MNTELARKIDLFAENRQKIGDAFKLDYGLNCLISSLILTGMNAEADVERMKEVRGILAGNTGLFTSFRATIEMVVLTKMSVAADPEEYIRDVVTAFNKIRGKRLIDTASMVLSAMAVVDFGKQDQIDSIVARTDGIMRRMRKVHPFITDDDDLTFAVLLAMTGKDVDTLTDEMEECYKYLKKTLKVKADANAIQGLCELIVLSGGSLTDKCDRAYAIFNSFAEHGSRYGSYYEFPSLGALIGIDMDKDELVDLIIETADTLKAKKGFGSWTLDNKERLMFAAMLVAEVLSDGDGSNYGYAVKDAVISSTVAAIIAEEVAVMVSTMTIINCANN